MLRDSESKFIIYIVFSVNVMLFNSKLILGQSIPKNKFTQLMLKSVLMIMPNSDKKNCSILSKILSLLKMLILMKKLPLLQD